MLPSQSRSVDGLIAAIAEHGEPKWAFFWGHRPNKDGTTGTGCFSQWWPCEFEIDGVSYQTAEHYMMAEKARLFGDRESEKQIVLSDSPGAAKALGRKVTPFNNEIWSERCFDIVVAGNVAKFDQNEDCRSILEQSGTKVLVEAAPRDRIWGIGMGASNENATRPENWRGKNLLGFALMEVREQLGLTSS